MKVRCTRPNASELISGVKFKRNDAGHMVSEEVDNATAARFCSVPGYDLEEDPLPLNPDELPPEQQTGGASDPSPVLVQPTAPAGDQVTQPADGPKAEKQPGKPGRKPKAKPAEAGQTEETEE